MAYETDKKQFKILIEIPAFGKTEEEAEKAVVADIKKNMPMLEFYTIYQADRTRQ